MKKIFGALAAILLGSSSLSALPYQEYAQARNLQGAEFSTDYFGDTAVTSTTKLEEDEVSYTKVKADAKTGPLQFTVGDGVFLDVYRVNIMRISRPGGEIKYMMSFAGSGLMRISAPSGEFDYSFDFGNGGKVAAIREDFADPSKGKSLEGNMVFWNPSLEARFEEYQMEYDSYLRRMPVFGRRES